jgi:hypothetical protein
MVCESVNIVSEMTESFIEREAMANLCLVCFFFFKVLNRGKVEFLSGKIGYRFLFLQSLFYNILSCAFFLWFFQAGVTEGCNRTIGNLLYMVRLDNLTHASCTV